MSDFANIYYFMMGILENVLLLKMIELFTNTKKEIYKIITLLLLAGDSFLFSNTDVFVYEIQLAILLIYVLFCCKDANFYMKLTYTFMMFASLLLLDIFFVSLFSHFIENNENLMDPHNYFNMISNLLSRILFLGVYLLLHTKKVYQEFIRKSQWLLFFVSTILIIGIIFILYYILIYYNLDMECTLLICFVILLYLILLFYVFSIATSQEKLYITKFEHKVVEDKQQQANEIWKSYEENRILRHDLKQHLGVLYIKLEQGDIHEAMQLISDITDHISSVEYVNTKNKGLNDILNIKINEMKKQDIQFHYHLANNLSFIEDINLIVLLGNVLDNAIEAQEDIKVNRRIDFDTYEKNSFVIIHVKNTYSVNKLTKKGESFLSHKKNKEEHGFGLISIQKVVDQYQGSIQYKIKNKMFETIIMFPKKQKIDT